MKKIVYFLSAAVLTAGVVAASHDAKATNPTFWGYMGPSTSMPVVAINTTDGNVVAVQVTNWSGGATGILTPSSGTNMDQSLVVYCTNDPGGASFYSTPTNKNVAAPCPFGGMPIDSDGEVVAY